MVRAIVIAIVSVPHRGQRSILTKAGREQSKIFRGLYNNNDASVPCKPVFTAQVAMPYG